MVNSSWREKRFSSIVRSYRCDEFLMNKFHLLGLLVGLKRMFNVVLMTLLEPLNKHFNLTKRRNLWAGVYQQGQ